MTQEKSFTLRFSLVAQIPDDRRDDEDFDEAQWLNEWEAQLKPGLIRAVFNHLRSFDAWEAHVRNRGVSPVDEIEIVVTRSFEPPKPLLQ
ncbi:MAG TPA: hypothetical protein VL403_14140 [Candidatus Kryptonia bacterium]|nr:hypothetical protein [Candidatus Kryptonia bacterium]